jgi:hypothetical protein
MEIGTRVILEGVDFDGEAGRIIAPYMSPFGPSWLVELDRGDTMAVRVADLREESPPVAPGVPLCAHCVRENLAAGYIAPDEDTWRPATAGEACDGRPCGWWSYPDVNTLSRRVALTLANRAAEDGGATVRLDVEEPTRDQLVAWVLWHDRNANVDDLTRIGLIELVVYMVADSADDIAGSDFARGALGAFGRTS